MEEELRDRWAALAGRSRGANAAIDALLLRYAEPHRRYHTARHLIAVVRQVEDLLAAVPDPGGTVDADAVRFAAWYHDAIYDPRLPRGSNEAASAALCTRRIVETLERSPSLAGTAARLIRATAAHEPSPGALDEAIVIDADLAIFAERPAVYGAYTVNVRAEYAHVPDDLWRFGRIAVLQSFLEKPTIFATPPMAAVEAAARANLRAELAGFGL